MNKASLAIYRARWQRFNSQLQARWQPLALREKRMVSGMAIAVIGLLVWVALIQPPLKKSLTGKAKRRSCALRRKRWSWCCATSACARTVKVSASRWSNPCKRAAWPDIINYRRRMPVHGS